jgi:hypothetical protein
MGIVWKPRGTGTSAFGSRYQATTGEDTAEQTEELVCAVVNYRVCELAIALQFFVVTIWKYSINPITNPNPVCSHLYT